MKTWVGFWELLTPSFEPSPKLQDQDMGLPVEASVNATIWPMVGVAGDMLKLAVGTVPAEAATMIGSMAELDPFALLAVRVTT